MKDTEDVIRKFDLGYAGPTMYEETAGKPAIYELDDATVAHFAYTYTYPNSGGPTEVIPEGAPWLKENLWPVLGAEGILAQAKKAKEDGADFVVASLHWGDEYVTQPNQGQLDLAEELLESDYVDLILGTHAHVIQPCQKINGKHVIYGMGNFISNQAPITLAEFRPEVQDGMIATFTLTKDADGTVTTDMEYVPTFVEIPGHTVVPARRDNQLASLQRTIRSVNALGGCEATLTTIRE